MFCKLRASMYHLRITKVSRWNSVCIGHTKYKFSLSGRNNPFLCSELSFQKLHSSLFPSVISEQTHANDSYLPSTLGVSGSPSLSQKSPASLWGLLLFYGSFYYKLPLLWSTTLLHLIPNISLSNKREEIHIQSTVQVFKTVLLCSWNLCACSFLTVTSICWVSHNLLSV